MDQSVWPEYDPYASAKETTANPEVIIKEGSSVLAIPWNEQVHIHNDTLPDGSADLELDNLFRTCSNTGKMFGDTQTYWDEELGHHGVSEVVTVIDSPAGAIILYLTVDQYGKAQKHPRSGCFAFGVRVPEGVDAHNLALNPRKLRDLAAQMVDRLDPTGSKEALPPYDEWSTFNEAAGRPNRMLVCRQGKGTVDTTIIKFDKAGTPLSTPQPKWETSNYQTIQPGPNGQTATTNKTEENSPKKARPGLIATIARFRSSPDDTKKPVGSEIRDDPIRSETRRRRILGRVAVAATFLLSAGIPTLSWRLHSNDLSANGNATQQKNPIETFAPTDRANTTLPNTITPTPPEQPALAPPPSAPKIIDVPPGSGLGLTHLIKDELAGKPGQTPTSAHYAQLSTMLTEKFGPYSIFQESHQTYITPSGEVRLYPGRFHWAPGIPKFLESKAEELLSKR